MIGNFITSGHAVIVVGYYASDMCGEARKLWNTNKEQFIKTFKKGEKDVEALDKFLTGGDNIKALYDVIEAKKIINTIFELGYYMEEYCTGEQHKQAPDGGEDFGFYLVECAQALYSGLKLIDELDPLGAFTSSYLDNLYQCL